MSRFKIDRVTDKYFLFWNTPCSQWFKHPDKTFLFQDEFGVKYYSAEHYMMYWKAMAFKNEKIAKMVLADPSPREVKKYGRMIENYDDQIWDSIRYNIVVKGNILKFAQNPDLLQFLAKYKYLKFVEASPQDKIWGIGLHFDDDRCLDESKWEGKNLLGKAINATILALKL